MKSLLQKIFEALYVSQKVKNQFDFGEKIGYNSGYVSKLLKKPAVLPPGVQNKLVSVFGVSRQFLETNGAQGSMFSDEIADNNNINKEKLKETDQNQFPGDTMNTNNELNSRFTKDEDMIINRNLSEAIVRMARAMEIEALNHKEALRMARAESEQTGFTKKAKEG